MLVKIGGGYGGRQEIADAVRSLLLQAAVDGVSAEELAQAVDVDLIGEHLYTKGQPDPDLMIRTSGEQRLGGFLLWQSAKRWEEHTSELQSLMRISYAVFCLKNKKHNSRTSHIIRNNRAE